MSGLITIAVSGPDGAGKSTLVRGLVRTLEGEGIGSRSSYLYGCVVCRRWSDGRSGGSTTMPPPSGARRVADRVHAVVDALELALRLAAAGIRARRPGASRSTEPVVLVTDRSPLDGLAKHLPVPRSLAARCYRWGSARYDRIFWLDADEDVLVARDGEHDHAEIGEQQRRFELAIRIVGSPVTPLPASAPAERLVGTVVMDIRSIPALARHAADEGDRSRVDPG